MKYDFFLLLLSGSQAVSTVRMLRVLEQPPSLSVAVMIFVPCAVCGVCAVKLCYRFYLLSRKGKAQ